MQIQVTSGIGVGNTELSSFDDALFHAGVSNYNLIYLSSVIPPGSSVEEVRQYTTPAQDFGKRLYVVKAVETTSISGQSIAAGIGWYQFDDGRGFFVEHHAYGDSSVKKNVKEQIASSLKDLCDRRKIEYIEDKMKYNLVFAECENLPISVLSLAVYAAQPW